MKAPRRTVVRIDTEQLAQAVLEVLDSPHQYARHAFAAAVVRAAKKRGSLDADF